MNLINIYDTPNHFQKATSLLLLHKLMIHVLVPVQFQCILLNKGYKNEQTIVDRRKSIRAPLPKVKKKRTNNRNPESGSASPANSPPSSQQTGSKRPCPGSSSQVSALGYACDT